jgi:hypothetical protein
LAATRVSGKGRVEGDAKKAVAETLDAHVAELKDAGSSAGKGGKARAKGGPQRVAKDKKEKTQEQIDMKELQKDVKSFPGVERTFVYKVELSTFISTKYVSPNVGQLISQATRPW